MDSFADPNPPTAQKLRGTFLAQPGSPAIAQAAKAPPPPVAAPASRLARPRINIRMMAFGALMLLLLGWPIYTLVHDTLTQGISRHGDYVAVDLKAMGNFLMPDEGTLNDVPAVYRALDGKRVELEGFMFSPREAGDRGTEFEFVYNVAKCCFGGPPRVQERVFAFAPPGRTVPIYGSDTAARIVGILHVKVVHNEFGKIDSVYTMEIQHAEPM